MRLVEPYEHRGKKFSEISTNTHGDFEIAINLFYVEIDIWLKKIIALRIIENAGVYDISKYESDLQEAIKCRIK